jgi:hypothetical protein
MSAPGTKGQFALWNGDKRAVMADVYKYLDNQLHGRPNSLHLDADPAFAVQKRNLISDLLGGTSVRSGAIPSPLSTKAGRDNSVKMFRIDRLNKVAESAGDPFPVDYFKVKENLMPEGGYHPNEMGQALVPDGSHYKVNSALVSRPEYVGNKEPLWERAQSSQLKSGKGPEPPSAVTGQSGQGQINPTPPEVNLMPLPAGVSPSAVIAHVEAQARADFSRKLVVGGAPPALAAQMAEDAWKEASKLARRKHSPHERGYALRAGALVNSLGQQELSAVRAATLKGGTQGAKAELGRQLQLQTLTRPAAANSR